ncbi:PNP-UDP-1 domain-containing protein [Fusarium sp. LHS14.1]|nr:PNP-UDP-1 domain-containing protein [Fusarium sp. LHS14.1]
MFPRFQITGDSYGIISVGVNEDTTWCGKISISSIRDICADLRQHGGQGKALMLLTEEYGLLGAWVGPDSSRTDQSWYSLDELILDGAFKPLDPNTLFHGASPACFSTKDKRALAVKLDFCLMDFFDVDLTSNRIYFLSSLKSFPKKEFPYLAIGPKLPATAELHNFSVDHPALPSFAKLLLEIGFGQTIDLDINPCNSQNLPAWGQLLSRVDRLAEERSDSYLQAIKSYRLVHDKISKALRTQVLGGKKADSTIRKKLYKEVTGSQAATIRVTFF